MDNRLLILLTRGSRVPELETVRILDPIPPQGPVGV